MTILRHIVCLPLYTLGKKQQQHDKFVYDVPCVSNTALSWGKKWGLTSRSLLTLHRVGTKGHVCPLGLFYVGYFVFEVYLISGILS